MNQNLLKSFSHQLLTDSAHGAEHFSVNFCHGILWYLPHNDMPGIFILMCQYLSALHMNMQNRKKYSKCFFWNAIIMLASFAR